MGPSKSRTPRTANRKKKSAHPSHHQEPLSGPDPRSGMGGLGGPFWDQDTKPASRGGDGSSRQGFRELDPYHNDGRRDSRGGLPSQGYPHKAMFGASEGPQGSLPHIHNPHGPHEAEQQQPSDSFLADYLGTLDKQANEFVQFGDRVTGSKVMQARSGRHHPMAEPMMGEEPDRRGGMDDHRGGLSSRGQMERRGLPSSSGSAKQAPAPFFRKPSGRTTYDLGNNFGNFSNKRGHPSTHFGPK